MTKLLKVALVLAVASVWARQANALTNRSGHMAIQVELSCTQGVSVDGTSYVSSYTVASTGLASAYLVPDSSATVRNTSSCAAEMWQLAVDTMTPAGGSIVTGWKHHNDPLTAAGHANNAAGTACLINCPAADEYGFQAMFASSSTAASYGVGGCPLASASDWDNNISTIPVKDGYANGDAVAVTRGSANTYWNSQYTFTGQSAANGKPGPDNFSGALGYMGPYVAATGVGQRALCARVTLPSTVGADSNGQPEVIRLSIFASGSL